MGSVCSKPLVLNCQKAIISSKDRLSNLPNSLIKHILSYLDIKEAICTSIFSRQFRYMWTGIPVLHIDQTTMTNMSGESLNVRKFVRLVDRVMYHDTSIECLHLAVCTSCDNSHVNRWILQAIRRNIKELHLSIIKDDKSPFKYPSSLFHCRALKSLKLGSISLNYLVALPSLESLTLACVDFGMYTSIFLSLIGFPNLKKFSIVYAEDVLSMMILAPNVKSVNIEGSLGLKMLSIDAMELEELCFKNWLGLRIENCTPKLKKVKWENSKILGEGSNIPGNLIKLVKGD